MSRFNFNLPLHWPAIYATQLSYFQGAITFLLFSTLLSLCRFIKEKLNCNWDRKGEPNGDIANREQGLEDVRDSSMDKR